jgi:hypothetical protein
MITFGYAINLSNAPKGVKYFGTFFVVAGSYSAFPGVVSWYAAVYVIFLYQMPHR